MKCESVVDRRVFVTGCVGAAGLLLLQVPDAVIGARPLSTVSVIISPKSDAAAAFGAALSRGGARCHVLAGDSYRFVRGLLRMGERPAAVAGMGTYADFILATGVLREARYGLVSHGLHASGGARHHCVGEWAGCESVLQRSAFQWPASLADVIAGYTMDAPLAAPPADLEAADTGPVLSWVMRSQPSGRYT